MHVSGQSLYQHISLVQHTLHTECIKLEDERGKLKNYTAKQKSQLRSSVENFWFI